MGRTSVSANRTALPALENSMMSCPPSVMAAPTRKSASSRSTAMIPLGRGREKSVSGVFLTVPLAVAMNTKCCSSNSRTGITTVIFSFSSSGKRFTTGLPRLWRPPCGTSYTLSQ